MKVSIYPFVNSLQEILICCMNFSAYVIKCFHLSDLYLAFYTLNKKKKCSKFEVYYINSFAISSIHGYSSKFSQKQCGEQEYFSHRLTHKLYYFIQPSHGTNNKNKIHTSQKYDVASYLSQADGTNERINSDLTICHNIFHNHNAVQQQTLTNLYYTKPNKSFFVRRRHFNRQPPGIIIRRVSQIIQELFCITMETARLIQRMMKKIYLSNKRWAFGDNMWSLLLPLFNLFSYRYRNLIKYQAEFRK